MAHCVCEMGYKHTMHQTCFDQANDVSHHFLPDPCNPSASQPGSLSATVRLGAANTWTLNTCTTTFEAWRLRTALV